LAAIVQDETLIGPCEAAAGLPAKGGPRQLEDIDIPAARAACDAALAVLPRHPLLVVLAGRIDQAEGRLDAARAAYEAGVAAGVPESFGLAAYLRFSPPDGGAPDYEAAAELARSGAGLGDWLSKEILMVTYSRALVAGNGPAEAVAIARENAEEGNVAAQFFLGYFLLSGTGVEMDEAEAAIWLRKASDGGYVRANPFLAEILERGEAVAAAPEDAARLIWEALGEGDAVTVARLTDQLSERRPEVIRFIQQKLRDAGVYKGRDDGIAGPGTVRAVQAYIETLQDEG
jgi:TPR repeat protein